MRNALLRSFAPSSRSATSQMLCGVVSEGVRCVVRTPADVFIG